MIGVATNKSYQLINESEKKSYLDKVLISIEDGLLSSKYYDQGVLRWLDLENSNLDVIFISWQRGLWGVSIPGTFIRPYKHPDQAVLANDFSNSVLFVILDAPGVIPITSTTPQGTGAMGIHNVSGSRAFGDGTSINPVFQNINANDNNILFYYAEERQGNMYYSYNHRYNFTNIGRPIEVGLTQTFFEYYNPYPNVVPTAYNFLGASVITSRYRFTYKSIQNDNFVFAISDIHNADVDLYLSHSNIGELYFYQPPTVNYNLTIRDSVLTVNRNALNMLSAYTNVTLNLYESTINELVSISISDLLSFLNEYDFWYNGSRYTSLNTSQLDDRYFTRNILETSDLVYEIVNEDVGIWRQFTNNGNIIVTVNANSIATIGDTVVIDYLGTGSLTIVAGADVTLQLNGNKTLVSDGQYSSIFIKKTALNTYRVFGELTPA